MPPQPAYQSPMIPLEKARWRLGLLWFGGAAAISLLLVVQSLFGVYQANVQEVWGWALPNYLPTLSLMLGVFAAVALADQTETDLMRVRKPFFWLAFGLSAFHLVCVAIVILVQPMLPSRTPEGEAYDVMASFVTSNLWLGPLQGLVALALGALFFSRSQNDAQAVPGQAPSPG